MYDLGSREPKEKANVSMGARSMETLFGRFNFSSRRSNALMRRSSKVKVKLLDTHYIKNMHVYLPDCVIHHAIYRCWQTSCFRPGQLTDFNRA